jgi:threonine/homoserine/homoserine lactone efflux protein
MPGRLQRKSAAHPKTPLFYGAFLPQFIVPGPNAADQFLLLAMTFLVIAVVLGGVLALLAARLRALLITHVRLLNQVTGGMLMGAELGLPLARRPVPGKTSRCRAAGRPMM